MVCLNSTEEMEVFGITGSISQNQTGPDVMEGDSAETSTVCDLRVGSSSQNENSTAPPAPKRMRLDTDRMEQPAAKVPFHANNANTPLTEAEQERLLAQSSSLPPYILQESDITKKQVKHEVENTEIAEFTEESKAHSQEVAGFALCPVGAKNADSDVTVGQTRGSLGELQDDEPVVKSHFSPITCVGMNALAFEKCAVSTYSNDRDSGVTAESSILTTDDFQQEFYDDACIELSTEEYQILRGSRSASDSSPCNIAGNPYGTLSGHREVGGSQDRFKSLFRGNAHACGGESKAKVNEEHVVCDKEMADYASTGSVFTYDVALSGDLGSNEPAINASLAHRVPNVPNAALWLSTVVEAEDLHKCDAYAAISAQSGLSQMPSNVCNDMAAVTGIDAGHEGNGADLESHIVPEHKQPEVNCSQASDSTSITTSHCASDMTLHGIIALEGDTAQCPLYPVTYTEGATVRNEGCELSDDHCAFVLPLNCDLEHLNIAHIPKSLSVDDELVVNYIGLSASLPGPNGCTEEKATTEDITRIHHHSLTFGSFTKPAESFDISAEAVVDSYTVGAHMDLLSLANLVSDPVDHHESVLEGAVGSSAGGMVVMGDEVGFFESSPSLSQMRQKLLSEDWEEKSAEISLQQPVALPQEKNAKVTDAVAHSDTSHEFTIKDKPMFKLSSDAIVPESHTTPAKVETEESPVWPGRVFSNCVPLGFDSFEKVKISPDSDLENSPLLDSSPNGLAAAAVTHPHTVSPLGISLATLTHSGICLDETTKVISQDSCPVSSENYSQERGIRRGREESPNSISVASLQTSSQQQHLLEPEENIHLTDYDIPLFEMKEMFDLVIEELCLYFEIGQEREEEESSELSAESRKEDIPPCYSPLSKSQDGAMASMSSGSILETEQEEVESSDDHKELDCEQEVPLENGPLPEGEDSMYSTMKTKDSYKPWSPAFLTAPFLEHLVQRQVESLPKRLEPLKTCSRPIRVGLSKKARTKQLHPNLK